jgi:hypothetical protein
MPVAEKRLVRVVSLPAARDTIGSNLRPGTDPGFKKQGFEPGNQQELRVIDAK